MDRTVVVRIEPSKRLSELCGFPYCIEKRVPLKELFDEKMIDKDDIKKMEQGNEIHKSWKVV